MNQAAEDLEQLFADSREQTRREYAELLNQCVRRVRQSPDAEQLCAVLGDAAALFASNVLLFRIEDGVARSDRIQVPLGEAPALKSCVEMRDPLVVLTSAAEVSAPVMALLAHEATNRAYLFPVVVDEQAPALLYCWGAVQAAAVELLSQVSGAVWNALPQPEPEPAPAPVAKLVSMAVAAGAGVAASKPATWEELAPSEQQLHLRAQRFARVQVAEIRLRYADAVQSGRTRRNLYENLREPIDASRAAFRKQFFTCPSMVDYLDLELTRTLAHDDAEMLGRDYPGPLV